MRSDQRAEFLGTVGEAQSALQHLERSSESEIDAATRAFRGLAGHADMVLKQAANIIGHVEREDMSAVLPRVQTLCRTVRIFLEERLAAATSILETLKGEEVLLRRLTEITESQKAVAAHLKALSVLTNIEVAKLGSVGHDFELLAQELSVFSNSVYQQTAELASHTRTCESTIAEARRELAASLPQLKREMLLMEADIAAALQAIEGDLEQLDKLPSHFRSGAEASSQQIAGVVAAIQSHDITRQQVEHVIGALQVIATRLALPGGVGEDPAVLCAGLTIQSCQLQNVRSTMDNWTSQIRNCMTGIQQLSATALVGIGPLVLRQEAELSSQLSQIERMQLRSQDYSAKIQNTLGGLSTLLKLVNEQMERSENIRHLLQLLTFNSLIEADHLGRRGTVVSAIANLIKEVSAEWNVIAGQSGAALAEILKLVTAANQLMEIFSDRSAAKMREDQVLTSAALAQVRAAAAFVAKEAAGMEVITVRMQSHLTAVENTGRDLEKCFGYLDQAVALIEKLNAGLQSSDAYVKEHFDSAEVERLFAGSYTIAIERDVMRAALDGTPLPVAAQAFAGNEVELF